MNDGGMTRWSLTGKRALITGGTKGIGMATAEEFLRLGADVFIVARSAREIETCLALWHSRGFHAEGARADVADPRDRAALMRRVGRQWDRLDILVNNAGTNIRKKTTAYTGGEVDRILKTNMDSAFDMCRRAYPLLREAVSASIVNIASVGGITALGTGTPYAMSKAAMIQMTRTLAAEWGPEGIRVNAIAPWYIRTPLAKSVLKKRGYMRAVIARTPLGRVGEAGEVAAAAAFLCMDAASYITGACLPVDGGFLASGFTPP